MVPETGEKLLCHSGLEGLFVRPMVPQNDKNSANYTIVWGMKHGDAFASNLSSLLVAASKIAGHRGLARSLIGLGLRVAWKDVGTARQLLRAEDPAILAENRHLKDQYYYTLDGIPSAASMPEISKFCRELPNWDGESYHSLSW